MTHVTSFPRIKSLISDNTPVSLVNLKTQLLKEPSSKDMNNINRVDQNNRKCKAVNRLYRLTGKRETRARLLRRGSRSRIDCMHPIASGFYEKATCMREGCSVHTSVSSEEAGSCSATVVVFFVVLLRRCLGYLLNQ